MRDPVDPAKVHRLLREIGRSAGGPGRVYLTGGATARHLALDAEDFERRVRAFLAGDGGE